MPTGNKNGLVYLIGAGPGDPELITVKGRRCLEEADVVIYDYLANPLLLEYAPPNAEHIYVGKKSNKHTVEQNAINDLLIKEAGRGRTVARLKGGDALIFGRGGEEALALAEAGIEYEIVPGVTSASAVPAYAGIPVTHRGLASDVTFVTGHRGHEDAGADISWDLLAQGSGTLVFLMGIKNLPKIVAELTSRGKSSDTPVAVIRWGTTGKQVTVTGVLSNIVDQVKLAELRPPAVIVIGAVVNLREKLAWFEKRPLFGKQIVVTRAAAQAGPLERALRAAGATVIDFPTLMLRPVEDYSLFDQAVSALQADPKAFDWTILTSVNAVRFMVKRLAELELDVRALGTSRLAAVGIATATALADENLKVDLIPADFRAEGLLKELESQGIAGQNILIPRAKEGRELLPDGLRELGATVTVAPLYENVPAETPAEPLVEALSAGEIDYITFTSGSTVKNLLEILERAGQENPTRNSGRLFGARAAIIGPIAAKTAERYGLTVDVLPKTATIPELVEAIIADTTKT